MVWYIWLLRATSVCDQKLSIWALKFCRCPETWMDQTKFVIRRDQSLSQLLSCSCACTWAIWSCSDNPRRFITRSCAWIAWSLIISGRIGILESLTGELKKSKNWYRCALLRPKLIQLLENILYQGLFCGDGCSPRDSFFSNPPVSRYSSCGSITAAWSSFFFVWTARI